MEGWIKLHRSIKNHWIFEDSEYLKYWIYLLLDVNHDDKKIVWNKELIEIKRGQKITSLQKLAKEFNCSREKVRRFLELLKNDTMISIESNTRFTQITICNYDNYQTIEHTKKTRKKHERDTKKTRTDTNKNVKNVKNKYIPEFNEFKNYVLENEPNINLKSLELKYKSWIENKWKDGNNKPIKNWKTKILNTITYLPKNIEEKKINLLEIAAKKTEKKFNEN